MEYGKRGETNHGITFIALSFRIVSERRSESARKMREILHDNLSRKDDSGRLIRSREESISFLQRMCRFLFEKCSFIAG